DALPLPSALDGPMLAVGMLRDGDKRASYQIIAETLALLPADSWRLDIAGDGPARTEIETMMAPFGDAVRFLGELDATAMAAAYRHASLLFWPGVNEAFGLAYLEAQAAGLPVVAQDRPGVRDVLAPASYPAPESGTAPLAAQITALLSDTTLRHTRAQAARDFVAQHHLLPTATATLLAGLESCGVRP
ncbi:glycosyltransferase family 4 protein, partial [Sulfitobacter pontiacus]